MLELTLAADLVIIGGIGALVYLILEQKRELRSDIDEFEAALGQILSALVMKVEEISNLKDYIPEFTVQQDPLTQILSMLMNKGSSTDSYPRHDSGQFAAGELNAPEEEKEPFSP